MSEVKRAKHRIKLVGWPEDTKRQCSCGWVGGEKEDHPGIVLDDVYEKRPARLDPKLNAWGLPTASKGEIRAQMERIKREERRS